MRGFPCVLVAAAVFLAETASGESSPYDAFVLRDYAPRRANLDAWETTARAIGGTLLSWDRGTTDVVVAVNGTPAELRRVLRGEDRGLGRRVVYLAAHQAPDGRWDFPGSGLLDWKDWLPAGMAEEPVPVVIVDTCHAAAVREWAGGGPVLYASAADELTSALSLGARRPVDLGRRYPEAVAWIRKAAGPEAEEISFLGLAWVRAFLETPAPPQTDEEWRAFFRKVAEKGAEVRAPRPPDVRSTISY